MTSHFDSNYRFYFLSGGAVGVGKDSQFEMGEATRYGSAAQRTPPHPLYAVVVLLLLVFGLFLDYDVRARWSAKVSVSECRLKDSGRKRPLASPLTETAWKQLLPRQEPGLPYSRRPHSPRLHLFLLSFDPFSPIPPRTRARTPTQSGGRFEAPYPALTWSSLFPKQPSSSASSPPGPQPLLAAFLRPIIWDLYFLDVVLPVRTDALPSSARSPPLRVPRRFACGPTARITTSADIARGQAGGQAAAIGPFLLFNRAARRAIGLEETLHADPSRECMLPGQCICVVACVYPFSKCGVVYTRASEFWTRVRKGDCTLKR